GGRALGLKPDWDFSRERCEMDDTAGGLAVPKSHGGQCRLDDGERLAMNSSPDVCRQEMPAWQACRRDLPKGGRRDAEGEFLLGGLGSVRAVVAVAFDIRGETLPDGAFRGVRGIRCAHDFAELLDRVLALEGHHDNRTFGHELDQPAEEGALLVDG